MSRTIRFRAWTRQNPPMPWSQKFIAISGNGEQMVPIGGTFTGVWHALGDGDEGLIIEQSTGLRDKNGKEIYEGDIVKTNSPDRANFNAGAIVMQQQMYLIINTPTYGDARLSHSEPLGYYCDMECEIIGNIHENPELLGGKIDDHAL